MYRPLLILIVAAMPALSAHGQLLKYNNQKEIFGAAMISPEAGGKLLTMLIKECSRYGSNVKEKGNKALDGWYQKHQAMIDENVRIRSEYFSMRGSNPERDEAKRTFDVEIPKMINAKFNALVSTINGLPSPAVRGQMCLDYIQSVEDGKWDLQVNDPVVFKFLQDRLNNKAR